MSRWLAFAQKAEVISETLPASQQEPSKRGVEPHREDFLLVSNGLLGGFSKEGARRAINEVQPDPPGGSVQKRSVSPYGTSTGGRPLTWTGKVKSLAAWREITEWERHGPDGKHFSGEKMTWEEKP
ncbi:MAG: hypothetical protein AAFY35_16540 [Pseudomonadota bacterium]